jgi:anaerobic selenocysteine-containing dehydrogenase
VDPKLTATARHADYVIAPRLPLEREDVTLFADMFYELPYAHYTPRVVDPGSDLIEDWELYLGLARRMKLQIELPGRALDPAQPLSKFALLEALTSGSRIPLARVCDQVGGHVFEELQVHVAPAIPEIRARLRLLPEGIAAELRVVRAEPVQGPGRYGQDGSFSHLLICRRLRHVMNSMGRDLPQAFRRGATNPAFINRTDLAQIGLSAGDLVEIESEHDSILGVAEPTDELQPGVISMAHCWGDTPERDHDVRTLGGNTSRLVSVECDVDPLTGMTRQTAIPVRIRPAARSAS